jgi:hypothetical protein
MVDRFEIPHSLLVLHPILFLWLGLQPSSTSQSILVTEKPQRQMSGTVLLEEPMSCIARQDMPDLW